MCDGQFFFRLASYVVLCLNVQGSAAGPVLVQGCTVSRGAALACSAIKCHLRKVKTSPHWGQQSFLITSTCTVPLGVIHFMLAKSERKPTLVHMENVPFYFFLAI